MHHARSLAAFLILTAAFISPADAAAMTTPAPASAPHADDAPKIHIDRMKQDWGRVSDLEVLHTQFTVTNLGGSTLIITELKPSCGCVKPRMRDNKREIGPAESVILDVSFEPGSKTGINNYHFDLRSTDPENPVLKVDVTCDVNPTILVEPLGGLSFGAVDRGTKTTRQVLVAGLAPDFRATFATVSGDSPITVKVGPTKDVTINGDARRQTVLDVTLPDTLKIGRFEERIFVRHTDKRVGLINVLISGEVLGLIRSESASIPLGVAAPEAPLAGEFKVFNAQGKPFTINAVEFRPRQGNIPIELKYTPTPNADRSAYTIAFSGNAPSRAAPITGEIIVTTDVTGEPPLRIPVSLAVRIPKEPEQPE
ncbi:MAG: DUF1573 domain-containing protein [Phycisphaeraceae bacterium]|nr:MAG: DUF1573 domain-containing protein [Phycisphaeraceae bacterium]